MKKIFLVLTAGLVALMAKAQVKLTLKDIRDSIVQNHPAFKMIDASYRATQERAEGAWSWMPPEVGAGFFQTPYNVGKWKGTPEMPGMGMFMVSGEQMLPNKKAQDAEYHFLKSKGDIELEKKSGMENEMLTRVRAAYYDLIFAEKKSDLFSQNEKLVDFMIQSAEIRYRNNLGTLNSYYKLKAALAKLKTSQKVLAADKAQQRAVINSLMLHQAQELFAIDTAFQWYPFGNLMGDTTALSQTSEYKVLDKSIVANQLEYQSELAALKPQFGIRYEHMVGFGHQPQMFSLMAMMKIPLARWSAKMNRAQAESLVYERQSMKLQQHSYITQQTGKARSLYAELQGIKSEMKMYDEEIIPALLKNMQTLQISYEQNKAEIFELFDAWQNLLDARMEYLNSFERGAEIQSELLSIFQIFES